MALDSTQVYTAAKGYIFTAPVGTAAPSVSAIAEYVEDSDIVNWETIGHTARDELPVFGYEGGDVETRGTWQAEVIKTVVTEAASDYVTFNVHQFDEANFEFYYGSANTNTTTPGVYSVNSAGVSAVNRALLIVICDGPVVSENGFRLGFYAPSTDIRREDSIELAVDEFAYMPLRATLTKTPGQPLFSWLNVPTPEIVGA